MDGFADNGETKKRTLEDWGIAGIKNFTYKIFLF